MPSQHEQTDAPTCDWITVVAMAENEVIGRNETLPWRLSSDLQRFKRLTMGHCLLMGRKTFTSIGKALRGRQTIVLSRAGCAAVPADVSVVSSLDDVAPRVEPGRKVMVVGGAQIYAATMDRCREIWLTKVLANVAGDTRFPKIDWTQWQLISSENFPAGPRDDFPTEFQIWRRSESLDSLAPYSIAAPT